jgi:hypothetical protein
MSKRLYGATVLVALLFSVYVLTSAGKFHIVDEVSLFAVTESLALRGAVDTNAIAWTQWVNSPGEVLGAFGQDGQVYSKKGPAPAFLAVPWYLLMQAVTRLDITIGLVQGTLLWNGLITAVTAALLWFVARRLHYSDPVGITLALLYGLCTIAWPYANHFFGEPLSALSLLFCCYGLLSFRRTGQHYWLVAAGCAAGVAMTTVVAHTVLLAIFGLYLLTFFVYKRPADPAGAPVLAERQTLVTRLLVAVAAFATPILIAGGLLLWYNAVRFGSPLSTGYHFGSGEGFSTPLLEGLWGLLVSPYRGVFWHTPLLLVTLVAFVPFLRRHPVEGVLLFALSFVLLSLYGRWWMWWGGFAWGPRFLVPLTPFWLLPLAAPLAAIEARFQQLSLYSPPAIAKAFGLSGLLIGLCALLSLVVQLLAVAVNYVNYEIQLRSIFPTNWEDPLQFGPPAQRLSDWRQSPVLGQWYLLRDNFVGNNDLAWLRADGDISVLTLVIGVAAIGTLLPLLVMVFKGYQSNSAEVLPSLMMRLSMPLIPLVLVGVWLGQSATDPHYGLADSGYRAVLSEICTEAKPTDVVVTVAPFAYQVPMNWLAGACDVAPPIVGYGVTNATEPEADALLRQLLESTERIWLVTGGLPANDPENSVERWLVNAAYEADDRWFDDYRLVRYASAVRMRTATTTQLAMPLSRVAFPEVTILSVTAPEAATSNAILPVALTYQLDQPIDINLHWFVQLLSSENYAVALVDTPPTNGYRTFADLPVAETQTEHVALQLPANLPPGRYRLIAGLYDPASSTGGRLRLPNGRDFVDLQTVTVFSQ